MGNKVKAKTFSNSEIDDVTVLFFGVLTLKIIFSFVFDSYFVTELFLPFINHFCSSPFTDPWQYFVNQGNSVSFPYSGVMLFLVSLPKLILKLFGVSEMSHALDLFLIKLPLLIADLAIFWVFFQWFPNGKRRIVFYYWCSPILIYISYIHGQLDVIPTAFLFVSLLFLFRSKMFLAGLILGVGVAAKAHLLIAVPFFLAYALKNSVRSLQKLKRFFGMIEGLLASSVLIVCPLLMSDGYRKMVLGTPEALKLFRLSISFSNFSTLYLAPAMVILVYLYFISIRRIHREVLIFFLALSYAILVTIVPSMPGWYYWAMPFIIYFCVRQGHDIPYVLWAINVLYLGFFCCVDRMKVWSSDLSVQTYESLPLNLVFTALEVSFFFMVYWMYQVGFRENYKSRIKSRPVCIGIGGDSGSGKDYLATCLRSLTGFENSAQSHGDDYHRWERKNENLKKKTHLSPEANFMLKPLDHLNDLRQWKTVRKREYDHSTGTFTKEMLLVPKPFIFYEGLHPFFIRRMREMFDLKIYLDPMPELRKYWKVVRDKSRGYTAKKALNQIKMREKDATLYIQPQREFADWVIRYESFDSLELIDFENKPVKLKAIHSVRNDINLEPVAKLLSSVPTLNVKWEISNNLENQTLEVDGTVSASRVSRIAFGLVPNLYEILGNETIEWLANYDGISQLLFLCIIKDIFNRA